ncbi:MAG: hypothetical protein U0L98_01315 [Clostridia bacterium]|nr:hypothetical protein [Clostridia bacterium]
MKKIKILTLVLAIVLVTMVAFIGIYVTIQNRMENKVKDYSYMMDLNGGRNIILEVDNGNKTNIKDSEGKEVKDTENLSDEELKEKGYIKEETPYNSEDSLNINNYKKCKEILTRRLKELKVQEYNIKLDEDNGNIVLDIPENDNTDSIVSELIPTGKFEIVDSETKEVLINNDDLKLVNVMYGSDNSSNSATSTGTVVYLNIEFTKDGARKLEDITNKYVKVETANTETKEDGENAENITTEKKISLMIDDDEMLSTSFEEPIKTGKMQLSIGRAAKDNDTLKGYISQASNMATVLNNGKMPVKYTVHDNQYIQSDITNNELSMIVYVMLAIVVVTLLFLIIKYRAIGALGAISYIGLASLFLLLIRYTNVDLSIQGILGIALTLVLNYVFIYKLVSKIKNVKIKELGVSSKIKETYKEFFVRILPICIAVIIFCFAGWATISSFGMVMFWGIVLIAIYNAIVTNLLFRINDNK